jgi:hypothetical protein
MDSGLAGKSPRPGMTDYKRWSQATSLSGLAPPLINGAIRCAIAPYIAPPLDRARDLGQLAGPAGATGKP